MTRVVGVEERRARLARRHRLLPQCRTDGPDAVPAVADALVALHSSDPVTVHLSAAARMRDPSVATVERALYEDRSVVRHHAMRRTLWVATPSVVRLMHAAATRSLVGPEHRRTVKLLTAGGVEDPEAWLADARARVVETLRSTGPLSARELGDAVPALRRRIVMSPGKSYSAEVSAHTRVLLLLGFEGTVVRTRPHGSWVSGAYRYALAESWLGEPLDGDLHAPDERESAMELALRWLRVFGPASTTDLQWWTGWGAATTRRALADCEAVEVALESGPGWLAPGDEAPEEPVGPWVALLPGLDPTTMGWKQREWYLPEGARGAFDRMGNAGPTVWADGRVVGVWDQGPSGDLRSHLFEDLSAGHRRLLDLRLAEVAETVGDTRFTVRFPSPVSAALRSGSRLE